MKSTINLKYLLFFLLFLFISNATISADDWSDLKEEQEFFGSEKEDKYSVNSYIIEIEDWENHYSIMLFGFFKYTKYPKYKSLRILPFYTGIESKIDNRKESIFMLPYPYYYRRNNDSIFKLDIFGYSKTTDYSYDKSYLYLYYHGKDLKSGNKYNILFPFYSYNKTKTDGFESNKFSTLFFSYYFENTNTEKSYSKFNFTSIPFYYGKHVTDNSYKKTVLFPIIPILYYSGTNNTASHYSFLSFFHFNYKNNNLSGIYNPLFMWSKNDYIFIPFLLNYSFSPNKYFYDFTFNPLFFYETDSFLHFPLLLSFNWGADENQFYTKMLNPLFSYEQDKQFNIHPLLSFNYFGDKYKYIINPLFSYYKDNKSTYSAFPTIPLIWYNSKIHDESGQSNSWNILTFFRYSYYKNNNQKKTSSLTVFPLYHHTISENSKFFLNPFFFHRSVNKIDSYSNVTGFPIIPFLYYNNDNSSSNSYNLFSFIRYKKNYETDSSYSFSPIHFYYNSENKFLFLSPIWNRYSNINSGRNINIINPFYYSFKNKNSSTTLFMPLYFESKSEDKYTYINLSGYSRTMFSGNFNLGINKNNELNYNLYYTDINLSWMYNLVGLHFRIPLNKKPEFSNKTKIPDNTIISEKDIKEVADNTPSLSNDIRNSRNTSLSFFGIDLFYGLFSYQKSETMNHIRMFPLAWFTWYNNNDNGIKFIPGAFFHYKKDELKYFLLFPAFIPIYGEQRINDSYKKVYGAIAYWDEYDSEKKRHEKTILWPIYNSYKSPKSEGWRVFPLIWHKENYSNNSYYSKTFAPFSYFSQSVTTHPSGIKKTEQKTAISPLYYINSVNNENSTDKTLFLPIIPVYGNYKRGSSNTEWVFPLYLSHENNDSSFKSILLNAYISQNSKSGKYKSLFWPFFSYSNYNNYKSYTILPLFTFSNQKDFFSKTFILYPLLSYNQLYKDETFIINPFFTYINKNEYTNDFTNGKSKSYICPPLLSFQKNTVYSGNKSYLNKYTGFYAGLYYTTSYEYKRFNWLYLIDYKNNIIDDSLKTGLLFNLLSYEKNTDYKLFDAGYGLISSYKSYYYDNSYEYKLGQFIYRQYNIDNVFYSSLFPLWWHKSSNKFSRTFFLPGLAYRFKNETELYEIAGMGLLWYRHADYLEETERRMVLLGSLYNYNKVKERGYSEVGQLWGLLWNYEEEEDTDFQKFSVLKFVFKHTRLNNKLTTKIFGIKISERQFETE